VRIWVIDTGSIIEILRRANLPRHIRTRAVAELDSRATAGQIIYPPEVLGELERAAEDIKKSGRTDRPLAWAKNHEPNGTRYGHLPDGAKAVLDRVPSLIDPDKISIDGMDDADSHVIALAIYVRAEGEDVRIITEDIITTPKKTALTDAAGVFGLGCVRSRTFLISEGIWDGKEGT
jgi:hypothetical protein